MWQTRPTRAGPTALAVGVQSTRGRWGNRVTVAGASEGPSLKSPQSHLRLHWPPFSVLPMPSDSTPHFRQSSAPIAWADPAREQAFQARIANAARGAWPCARHREIRTPMPASALFPRGWQRSGGVKGLLIIMDAPPQHEDCKPFVSVARLLEAGGVAVRRTFWSWDELRASC